MAHKYHPNREIRIKRAAEQHERRVAAREQKRTYMRQVAQTVNEAIPDNPIDEFPLAREITRKFILHVGPTNSGKTHDSIERLKKAKLGAYLGPLRLLALEVYDKLTSAGVPCSMVTGEERIITEGATITSSTIEMMNTRIHFDVVVVDEVQMIADPHRGYNWTKAIIGLCADEIHLCMAPEAMDIAIRLIKDCGDDYEIVEHKRATPLLFENAPNKGVRRGDALIVFSRKNVLATSAELESKGIKASVIYGNLPPASRKEQVRKFTDGETTCVVSTDAIGMGINLPIQRVVFLETKKFDGESFRTLLPEEIKQIAGRAGRYGIYDTGYVNAEENSDLVRESLNMRIEPIRKAHIGFSESVAMLPFPLPDILDAWAKRETPDLYEKMDISEIMELYNNLGALKDTCPRSDIYQFITCSVDAKNTTVLDYWRLCCKSYAATKDISFPSSTDQSLRGLEDEYKCVDLYYQFSTKFGLPFDEERIARRKAELESAIDALLVRDKKKYAKRCSRCGRSLPASYKYSMCEKCYYSSYIK